MLRGSFTDVLRGYSRRADSVRHEYFSWCRCDQITNIATSLDAQAQLLHLFQI